MPDLEVLILPAASFPLKNLVLRGRSQPACKQSRSAHLPYSSSSSPCLESVFCIAATKSFAYLSLSDVNSTEPLLNFTNVSLCMYCCRVLREKLVCCVPLHFFYQEFHRSACTVQGPLSMHARPNFDEESHRLKMARNAHEMLTEHCCTAPRTLDAVHQVLSRLWISLDYNPYNPPHNPIYSSFRFIFHFLFHLILHY